MERRSFLIWIEQRKNMKEKMVLLVEDNADDEALTLRAFQKARIKNEIFVARDGQAALDYLFCKGEHANHDIPEVVLLDLKLPKIDGLEVLKRLRADERTKMLPVIILTSSKEEQDMIAGYEGGANSYIVKPVDSKQFSDCIQQLGLYWLVLNESAPK
jgi:two-component system response regulator